MGSSGPSRNGRASSFDVKIAGALSFGDFQIPHTCTPKRRAEVELLWQPLLLLFSNIGRSARKKQVMTKTSTQREDFEVFRCWAWDNDGHCTTCVNSFDWASTMRKMAPALLRSRSCAHASIIFKTTSYELTGISTVHQSTMVETATNTSTGKD
jgi:hypothetical protein